MPLLDYLSHQRSDRPEMNISYLKRITGNLLHRFVVCVAIFICFQLVLLLFQLSLYSNLLCKSTLFNRDVRIHIFKCADNAQHHHHPKISQHLIAYFDNPFEQHSSLNDGRERDTKNDGLIVRVPAETIDSPWHQSEAIAAMNAAKRFRATGNYEKARTVVKHAYSLAPHNPDILTEYGILLESANNIVEAEGYYFRALNHDPKHSEALQRRAKALPLVEEIDNRMLKEIFRKRDIFLKIPHYDSGLKRALRDSYFQHIYHTVAMEGNTMTLVQTRSLLETKVAVGGKSIIEHNEILGMDAAMRYLNQTLAEFGNLKLEHILQIHKRVLGYVDPFAAGEIRTTQVYVGSFTPPPPEDIMAEMDELLAWLNDEDTLNLDAVEVAALAHYKLVFIHPFIDGNGRTSRLLMNFILMQAGFPPVIIHVENRLQYYSALQSANKGDLRPFIRFIAQQMDRTLANFIASSSSVCDAAECRQSDRFMTVEDASPPTIEDASPSTIAGLP